jgi:hypothetical protein
MQHVMNYGIKKGIQGDFLWTLLVILSLSCLCLDPYQLNIRIDVSRRSMNWRSTDWFGETRRFPSTAIR